jgi:hypothetical protein
MSLPERAAWEANLAHVFAHRQRAAREIEQLRSREIGRRFATHPR